MPSQSVPAAMTPTRIDPLALLWVLAGLAALTLYPPDALLETLRHLRVPDTDDAMRLVGVRDLADGQGWFDNAQHRFLPPEGVASHWSRLIDAPLAGLVRALTPLLGQRLALGATAALWPPLLLALYALVLHRGVRASFGPRAALLALIAATQTPALTVQFQPGRVDHHGAQLTVILALAVCLVRGGRAGWLGGALAALSLAIGLEGLPFVVLAGAILAADWAWRGSPALPALRGFGLGLGLVAPALFWAQTAPGLWAMSACDALSPPWLWLAGGGMAVALGAAALDRRRPGAAARLALLAGLGLVIVSGFALLFPSCLGGPFTGMSALVRDRWLLTVNEMTSMPRFLAEGKWEILVLYPVLPVAALAATWGVLRGSDQQRRAWLVAALFLWPGAVLGLVQLRGVYVAAGLVPLVAGVVIDRALLAVRQPVGTRTRLAGALPVLAAALLGTAWAAPAFIADALSPERSAAQDPQGGVACRSEAAMAPLAALPRGTVLGPILIGPAILLHTPHAVVAAPYHRALPGLTAAIEGLGGTEADLRRHVAERGATYVAACPARPAADLQDETAFATRLARGEAAASWLEPVPLDSVLRVWRVR